MRIALVAAAGACVLLEQKMEELREHFELEKEDLNIDLGPLGKLL